MMSVVTSDTYNSIINVISPQRSQPVEFANGDSKGGVEERSQGSHKRSQLVTIGHIRPQTGEDMGQRVKELAHVHIHILFANAHKSTC